MEKFTVKTRKQYEKNGETKNVYMGVGTLMRFDDGGMALELNMFPGQKFYVFAMDDKQQTTEQPAQVDPVPLKVEDIPF